MDADNFDLKTRDGGVITYGDIEKESELISTDIRQKSKNPNRDQQSADAFDKFEQFDNSGGSELEILSQYSTNSNPSPNTNRKENTADADEQSLARSFALSFGGSRVEINSQRQMKQMQNSDDSDQYDAFDSEPKFEIPPGELDADEKQIGVVDEGQGTTKGTKHSNNQALKKGKQSWSEEMKDVFKEVVGEQLHTKVDQHQKHQKAQRSKDFIAEDHVKKVQSKAESIVKETDVASDEFKDELDTAQKGQETVKPEPKNKLAVPKASSWQTPIKATQITTKKATVKSTEPAEGDSADIYDQYDSRSPLNDSNDVRINHIIPFEKTMNHFEEAQDLKRQKVIEMQSNDKFKKPAAQHALNQNLAKNSSLAVMQQKSKSASSAELALSQENEKLKSQVAQLEKEKSAQIELERNKTLQEQNRNKHMEEEQAAENARIQRLQEIQNKKQKEQLLKEKEAEPETIKRVEFYQNQDKEFVKIWKGETQLKELETDNKLESNKLEEERQNAIHKMDKQKEEVAKQIKALQKKEQMAKQKEMEAEKLKKSDAEAKVRAEKAKKEVEQMQKFENDKNSRIQKIQEDEGKKLSILKNTASKLINDIETKNKEMKQLEADKQNQIQLVQKLQKAKEDKNNQTLAEAQKKQSESEDVKREKDQIMAEIAKRGELQSVNDAWMKGMIKLTEQQGEYPVMHPNELLTNNLEQLESLSQKQLQIKKQELQILKNHTTLAENSNDSLVLNAAKLETQTQSIEHLTKSLKTEEVLKSKIMEMQKSKEKQIKDKIDLIHQEKYGGGKVQTSSKQQSQSYVSKDDVTAAPVSAPVVAAQADNDSPQKQELNTNEKVVNYSIPPVENDEVIQQKQIEY